MEVVTSDSLVKNNVLYANGVMRRKFGWTPKSAKTSGPGALMKLGLSKLAKTMWKEDKPMPKSERTFDIDPDAPTGFRERRKAG